MTPQIRAADCGPWRNRLLHGDARFESLLEQIQRRTTRALQRIDPEGPLWRQTRRDMCQGSARALSHRAGLPEGTGKSTLSGWLRRARGALKPTLALAESSSYLILSEARVVDRRLRQLHRDADASCLETQVRLLREQLRAGALREERVRLAAYLGYPAAGVIAEARAAQVHFDREYQAQCRSLGEWIAPIGQFGHEALVRAGLAVAERVRTPSLTSRRRSLALLEAWAVCPCERCASHARSSLAALRDDDWTRFLSAFSAVMGEDPRVDEAARALSLLVWQEGELVADHLPAEALYDYVRVMCVRSQRAVVDDLVPWALSLWDPVADRVSARMEA